MRQTVTNNSGRTCKMYTNFVCEMCIRDSHKLNWWPQKLFKAREFPSCYRPVYVLSLIHICLISFNTAVYECEFCPLLHNVFVSGKVLSSQFLFYFLYVEFLINFLQQLNKLYFILIFVYSMLWYMVWIIRNNLELQ